MGTTKTLFLESDEHNGYWEGYYRRNYPFDDWQKNTDSEYLCAVSDDQEDLGNDVSRRERLAEAEYEL